MATEKVLQSVNHSVQNSILSDIIREGYNKIFRDIWSPWVGGILIGLVSILTFAWDRPWGVAGGLRLWGDWGFYLVGLYEKKPITVFSSSGSVIIGGMFCGSLAAALIARQFNIRLGPPLEIIKGVVGGILLGFGAALAGGCNVGGFFSSVSALSLSGLVMMAGLLFGAILGIKYVYWEVDHLSQGDWGKLQNKLIPWLQKPRTGAAHGFLVLAALLFFTWLYGRNGEYRLGGLTLAGTAFGIIIQRARFCFVRAFREPFFTGEANIARATIVALIISILGFAVLKWTGLRGENVFVQPAVWFGALAGGLIFGFGMVVSGGCASGTLWRAAEGNVKMYFVLFFFALTNSLIKSWIRTSPKISSLIGERVYLPDHIPYELAVFLIILILLGYYLFVSWNERTKKYVIDF